MILPSIGTIVSLFGIRAELDSLWTDFVQLIDDLSVTFPNLPRMVDLLTRFTTSLLGRLVAIPTRGVAELLVETLRIHKLHNRLIRLDDAVRLVFRGYTEFHQQITLTDETGIIGVVAGIAASWVYRLVKKFRLIAKLIAAESEAEFVLVITTAIRTRVYLLFWVGFILLSVVVVSFAGAVMTALVFFIPFASGLHHEYLLPQDSRREWQRKSGSVRINLRRGRDRRKL